MTTKNQTRSATRAEQGTVTVQEVSEAEFEAACEAAQDKAKLGRLRAYLRPILSQQARNIASAAASSISDFEAMKRGNEMLSRIENEEEEVAK